MKILKDIAVKRFSGIYHTSIIALLIFGTILVYSSLARFGNENDKEMQKVASFINNQVNSNIDKISFQSRFISSKIIETSISRRKIRSILTSFAISNSFNNDSPMTWNAYSWIDRSNKISLDGSFGIIKNKPDVSGRDYMRFTRYNPGKIVIGNVVSGALSHRLIVPIALGIFNKDYKYSGTLVFGLDVEKAVKKIKNTIDNDLYQFLVFKDNTLLFTSSNITEDSTSYIQKKIKILSLGEHDIAEKASSQGLFFGEKFNSFFIKNKSSSIGVLAIMDSYAYRDMLLNKLLESMILIFFIAILFFFLFQILYNRLIKPISHLSEYASQIAKRNFNIRIQKPINKELHEIFDSLNLIAEQFNKEQSMKKQLAEINKKITNENLSKNHFFEAICHDIREPLFEIVNDIKKIEKTKQNKDTVKEAIAHVDEALQITDDLLDIAQTSSGGLFIDNKKTVNPEVVVQKSIKICSSLATNRKIKIKYKATFTDQDSSKKINTDQKRLRQTLVNILTKLISLSVNDGEIHVSTEEIISNQSKKLQISILSTIRAKNTVNNSSKKVHLDKLRDNDSGLLDIDFRHSKEMINKMGGELVVEQRKNNSCRIFITFTY